MVQSIGVFAGAPFVVLCGMTESIGLLMAALACWGFFKGMYDANIFASVYDVIPPESRGSAAGLMNTIGWLGGGALAPVTIGVLAARWGLSAAIAMTGGVYLVAGALLLLAIRRCQGTAEDDRF
jgi:MFS family permease